MHAGPTAQPTESFSRTVTVRADDGTWIDGVRHVYVWDSRPVTANEWQRTHRAVRHRHVTEWRTAFKLMSDGCAPLAWCNIVVDHIVGTRRSVDVGAPFPCVKAAIDGVVLGGVLPDDTPLYVRSLRFNAPVYEQGRDALVVTFDGPAA